jgi:hypothetical protein
MTSPWRPLPDRLGHVRTTGPRPALRTAQGEYLRLHGVPAGGRSTRRTYLREVADFARRRAAEQYATRWPEGRRRIAVIGRTRLAAAVVAEVRRLGADVRRLRRPVADHGADLVVVLTEGRPGFGTEAWLTSLPSRGTAVLHGHADGASFLLMPLAVDGTEASADQVRRRRLAASPAADELGAWLSAPHHISLAPGVRALATARVAGAALAWAADGTEAEELRHTLTVLHPDLRETRHVVLGFDEPAVGVERE